MKYYKFTQDQLEHFAKKVYEEGCYGYMDLKESVCNTLVVEFISTQQLVLPINTNIIEQECISRYFTTGSSSPSGVIYNEGVTSTSTGNVTDISFGDWGISDQVRPDEYIHIDQNFPH